LDVISPGHHGQRAASDAGAVTDFFLQNRVARLTAVNREIAFQFIDPLGFPC